MEPATCSQPCIYAYIITTMLLQPLAKLQLLTMVSSCCVVPCRSEVERRTHPLSKADFVLLESELETWRQQQTAAIKNAGLVQQEEQV
jgi:hypothetical protein